MPPPIQGFCREQQHLAVSRSQGKKALGIWTYQLVPVRKSALNQTTCEIPKASGQISIENQGFHPVQIPPTEESLDRSGEFSECSSRPGAPQAFFR